MKVILYETNTGFTKEYAQILGNKLSLPCYTLKEAKQIKQPIEEVFFLSWVCANKIEQYKEASKRYPISAVLAVGLAKPSLKTCETLKQKNHLPDHTPLFMLLGGVNPSQLKGIKKMMFTAAVKAMSKVKAQCEEDKKILDVMRNGGTLVSEANLESFLAWYSTR